VEHCPSGTSLRHTHAGSGSDSPDFPAVNSVIISGTVLKQYGDILSPTGHLFLRVTVMTVTGQAFAGTLIGTSMFTIVIRQDSGLDILFQKGSPVYVCPAPQQSQSEV
jgi:hypothetical protein